MAKNAAGPAGKQTSVPAVETVGVKAEHRKTFKWVDIEAQSTIQKAIDEKRKEFRKKGTKLTPRKIVALVKLLDRIQRKLNPLEVRKERLVNRLKIHWGHVGSKEIETVFGNALLSLSTQLGLDEKKVEAGVTHDMWEKITTRQLDALRALVMAASDDELRKLLVGSIVATVTPTVTSSSSRRPKSGQAVKIDKEAA